MRTLHRNPSSNANNNPVELFKQALIQYRDAIPENDREIVMRLLFPSLAEREGMEDIYDDPLRFVIEIYSDCLAMLPHFERFQDLSEQQRDAAISQAIDNMWPSLEAMSVEAQARSTLPFIVLLEQLKLKEVRDKYAAEYHVAINPDESDVIIPKVVGVNNTLNGTNFDMGVTKNDITILREFFGSVARLRSEDLDNTSLRLSKPFVNQLTMTEAQLNQFKEDERTALSRKKAAIDGLIKKCDAMKIVKINKPLIDKIIAEIGTKHGAEILTAYGEQAIKGYLFLHYGFNSLFEFESKLTDKCGLQAKLAVIEQASQSNDPVNMVAVYPKIDELNTTITLMRSLEAISRNQLEKFRQEAEKVDSAIEKIDLSCLEFNGDCDIWDLYDEHVGNTIDSGRGISRSVVGIMVKLANIVDDLHARMQQIQQQFPSPPKT